LNTVGKNIFIKFIRILITFILVDLAWIFFKAKNISDASIAFTKIFTTIGSPLFVKADVIIGSVIALMILFIKEIKDEFFPNKISFMSNTNPYIASLSMVLLFLIILLLGVFDSGQFIYFQF
jgi:hypothetical protein